VLISVLVVVIELYWRGCNLVFELYKVFSSTKKKRKKEMQVIFFCKVINTVQRKNKKWGFVSVHL
jgi:hypothetical protein